MDKVFYNTQVAAETLDRLLPGESVAYWRNVLIDNRTHQRPEPFRIGVTGAAGAALYTPEELQRFARLLQGLSGAEIGDVNAQQAAPALRQSA